MPNNITSAEKARLAQQARHKAALKKQQAGGRSRGRPAASATQPSGAVQQSDTDTSAVTQDFASAVNTESASALQNEAEQMLAADDTGADELCEVVFTDPSALGSLTPAIRKLCRNRRKIIATHGKAGVAKTRRAISTTGHAMLTDVLLDENAGSRTVARKRRSMISQMGRGNQPKSRPSRPPRNKAVPPKVEIGTTLSGGEVTGTQVERTTSVTGNESGTCRPVTGTEYIGTEQFNTFCETRPEAATPKVGVSITASGSSVSGTEIGRSIKVSGDEQGSCQTVTGSEYLGSERFADFCDNKGLNRPAPKVMAGTSQKQGITITGVDEARRNRTTGTEIGADKAITGSQYTEAQTHDLSRYSSQRSTMPGRMERRETSGGAGVTGSEYSAYEAVTGSDYSFSSPSFSYSRANSEPAAVPQKVGVDASCSGQRITGNLVDRSEKVTGNEQGSGRHLTGSQYGRNSCTQPSKIPSTHAFAGGRLTGNRIEHDPKINGDGLSGCQPITGTELHGLAPFADHCSTTQAPVSAGFDNTFQPVASQQVVEGQMHSAAPAGTIPSSMQAPAPSAEPGTETYPQYAHGVQNTAPEAAHHGACCESCAARQMAEQAGLLNNVMSAQHQVQAQPHQHAAGMITGPDSMGTGLISGTPESRYPQQMVQAPQMYPAHYPAPEAPVAQYAQQPAYPQGHVEPVQAVQPAPARRITGEGREGGLPITGDNWARGEQVTGTEGRWAQNRNPTLQIDSRMVIPGAHQNKEMQRPAVAQPLTPITGSSGSCDTGAQVTVSGGARG